MDWRHRAVCRDVDPEVFFPVAETGPALAAAEATAKAVCAACPVRAECLAYATDTGQVGMWGGTSESERRHGRATRLRGRPRTRTA